MPKNIFHAGNLEMIYDSGSLRYIRAGEEELLRRIYIALRDEVWRTFSPVISNEKIIAAKDGFTISYDCHYEINSLPIFRWNVTIEGNRKNEIVFSISGVALATFKKNRAGLCVLHPIKSCAGQICEITSTEGEILHGVFPTFIAPHQPFVDIQKMRWTTPHKNICEITFEGDIFETEDQRNWTDASFKTYSTPLHLPFPVTVHKGDTIRQKMKLSVFPQKQFILAHHNNEADAILTFDEADLLTLPYIGICRSNRKLNKQEVSWLRELQSDHYRVDIKLAEDNWRSSLSQALDEATLIETKLAIALHLNHQIELKNFISVVSDNADLVTEILLLGPSKITDTGIMKKYIPILKKHLPNVKIGAGTDCYFADLNRNRMKDPLPDFISFSVNPQVHAFDDCTLIENMKGQYDAVISAKKMYPALAVHVSPITLKPRFNSDKGKKYLSGNVQYDRSPDSRQHTVFAAAWMLGSIRNLAAAGAAAITFFQSVGDNGIIYKDHETKKIILSPEYLLLSLITPFKKVPFFAGTCNDPLKCTGIFMVNHRHRHWIIANHSKQELFVQISNLEDAAQLREINSDNTDLYLYNHDFFLNQAFTNTNSNCIRLNPESIAVIDQK